MCFILIFPFVADDYHWLFVSNSSWKDDLYLMQQLKERNSKGMRRQEILSYMKRDFSQ